MCINEIATICSVVRDDGWKKNGTNILRLRLTFRRQSRYIKTNILLRKNQLDRNGQIKDTAVLLKVTNLIKQLEERLSSLDAFALSNMSIEDVVKFLQKEDDSPEVFKLDFFSFADSVIEAKTGQSRKTYQSALNSFKQFCAQESMDISDITSSLMRSWESWLVNKYGDGARSVSAYTACIAFIHGQARLKYNDEETGIIRIKNPFQFYKPPRQKITRHRDIDAQLIQKMIDMRSTLSGREKLGVDVFLISFALMGMNSPDLFSCAAPINDVLHYYRTKTRSRRDDKAEMFVKIDPLVKDLMKEYRAKKSKIAFDFCERYSSYQVFGENVNEGLAKFCTRIGYSGKVTLYGARHSWASIAYKTGVEKGLINDGLCHVDKSMKVTDIYINKDWSVLWKANTKVLKQFKWIKSPADAAVNKKKRTTSKPVILSCSA